MVTIIEDLPDEILLVICRHFHPFDLVYAFRYLNTRFDALLRDCDFFQHIIVDSDKIASNYTHSIIKYGRQGLIKTLKATVQCRWLDLSHLISLERLVLLRPTQEQKRQLCTIMPMTKHLDQLTHLTLIESDDSRDVTRSIMTGMFPRLRQCHLHRWYNEQSSNSSLLRCESLRSLTIDIIERLDTALNILISLPNLITFRVNHMDCFWGTIQLPQVISYTHNHLKHCHISLLIKNAWYSERQLEFYRNMFGWILPILPKLATLSIRLTVKCSIACQDFTLSLQQLLTKIAEYLPMNCYCDCILRCGTGKQVRSHKKQTWYEDAKAFISNITNIQSGLIQKHSTFGNLGCRCIGERYVEIYTIPDSTFDS